MFEITVVLACLFLNALLACFEMAFVSVTKPQLRQLAKAGGSPAAARLLELREKPERTLSVVQIGITLVGMVSAAVGGAGATESFAPYFEENHGWSETAAEGLAILLIVIPLTFFNVVLGELVPKAFALRSPLRLAMAGAHWVRMAENFMSPVVSALETATKFFLFFLPKRVPLPAEAPTSVEIDHLSKPTQQYVLNLVSVESMRARDAMVDWPHVSVIPTTASRDEIASTVLNSGHTRLPVLNDGRVIGLLHTKEFITLLATGETNWQGLIRPVLETKEDTFVLAALRAMQERRSHLCVVVGSHGRPVGVLTMEDVLEEIIGEIFDEDDDGRARRLLASRRRR